MRVSRLQAPRHILLRTQASKVPISHPSTLCPPTPSVLLASGEVRWNNLVRNLVRHLLATHPSYQYCKQHAKCKGKNERVPLPSRLFEHAASAVRHFFVHAALLLRVYLSAAEFLFGEIETCECVSDADGGSWGGEGWVVEWLVVWL